MNSVSEILVATGIIVTTLLVIALLKRDKTEGWKLFLFWAMVVPIIFTTLALVLDTIAKNQQSVTGGPVHWHADYEIFVCGKSEKEELHSKLPFVNHAQAHEGEEEIDLEDPKGISNRIGTSDFHEHGDNRIHVEGVVQKLTDVSLGNFFRAVGGELTYSSLTLPTDHGQFQIQSGDPCPDGKSGTLQVFVYQTRGDIVTQEKINDFPNYVLSPYGQVPPGDCIIIEFVSQKKSKTDKLCDFYAIALQKGELKYGN